jgi:hypothetical protein
MTSSMGSAASAQASSNRRPANEPCRRPPSVGRPPACHRQPHTRRGPTLREPDARRHDAGSRMERLVARCQRRDARRLDLEDAAKVRSLDDLLAELDRPADEDENEDWRSAQRDLNCSSTHERGGLATRSGPAASAYPARPYRKDGAARLRRGGPFVRGREAATHSIDPSAHTIALE